MEWAVVAPLDQPNAVPMTIPRISPMAQPVRQWTVALNASRLSDCSATAHQPRHRGHELVGPLDALVAGGAHDAVLRVLVEQAERHLVQRRLHGGDLGEDVDAVAVVGDHALDPADLALDAAKALEELVL